jgi:hypothetical protein
VIFRRFSSFFNKSAAEIGFCSTLATASAIIVLAVTESISIFSASSSGVNQLIDSIVEKPAASSLSKSSLVTDSNSSSFFWNRLSHQPAFFPH